MAKRTKRDQEDDMAKSLECFKNQPNINMVIPWIYEMAKNMASSRDGDSEDEVENDLKCFLNQPNINMTIPWIYQIYKSVKSGGGEQEDYSVRWEDLTGQDDVVDEP